MRFSRAHAIFLAWAAVFGLSLITAFTLNTSRGLFEPTEGRYALSAQEMLRSGRWLEPTLFGQPHFSKPPLSYWIYAGALAAGTPSVSTMRLPGALAFVGTTMAVTLLGSALFGHTSGVMAGAIYATSPYPVAMASAVGADTFLSLWTTFALCLYVTGVWRSRRRSQRIVFTLAVWVCFGLGFLTKRPPALLPGIAIAIDAALHTTRVHRVPLWAHAAGFSLFLVVGLSWYVYCVLSRPELLSSFLGDELFRRIFTDFHKRNPEPIAILTMYLPILVLGTGVWSLIVIGKLIALRSRIASIPRCGSQREWTFCLVGIAVPFLVFCLAQSRLPGYLLPLFALIAPAQAEFIRRTSCHPATVVLITLFIALATVVAGKAIAPVVTSSKWDMAELARRAHTLDPNLELRHATFSSSPMFGYHFLMPVSVENWHPEHPASRPFPSDRVTTIVAVRASQVEAFKACVATRPIALQLADHTPYFIFFRVTARPSKK